MESKKDDRPWAVIFVHGIGGSKPGEMHAAANQALGAVRKAEVQGCEELNLDDSRKLLVTRASMGGRDMRVTEAFWGEISSVRRLGLVIGTLTAFLRLPYVIDAALRVQHCADKADLLVARYCHGIAAFRSSSTYHGASLGVFGFALRLGGFQVDTTDHAIAALLVAIASISLISWG